MQLGVDTGGTFTDLVTDAGDVVKVTSTPTQPDQAVRDAIDRVTTTRPALLAHGTTVATNALLEGRGGRVALVATRGFADVIEIARQTRPSLYDPYVDRPPPLVPRELRFEVSGRLDGTGHELEPLDPDTVPAVPDDVDVVAVSLLHADLDATHEQTVATALARRGVDVTCSHEVSPQFREYERTVTTVANAMLRPPCRDYLHRLADLADEVLVMTSAGGLMAVDAAA
jgi:N-methylhydantoinase A/oxoprolinase/acetone carboxylase beta subunit